MGRAPCCDKANVKRGPWSPEEDTALKTYVEKHGTGGNWIALPSKAGLRRCGKSCRLRWLNYLRPDIKHGGFTEEEDKIICTLYKNLGSRWSIIASHLPGRTDNDVKNYWNTKLKKKLMAAKSNPSEPLSFSASTRVAITAAPSPPSVTQPRSLTYGFSTQYTPPSAPASMGAAGFTYSMNKILQDASPFSVPQADPSACTNNFSLSSSSQDLSGSVSASPSLPIDESYIPWPSNPGGEFDNILMDLGYGSQFDYVSSTDFQDKLLLEAYPANLGFSTLLASGDTQPPGIYRKCHL